MNRIVFAGTPAFARESLQALLNADMLPVAVLTQPDRPAGRGKKLTPSPVKVLAEDRQLPLLQPATLGSAEVIDALRALRADVFVVAAYGLLLPQRVLDLPQRGCVNVHASLLPRWRGAAPIQAAILAGDIATGISLMQMEAGLDTGPVFARESTDIGASESAGELHDRLAALGGRLLAEHLPAIVAGDLAAIPQNDADSTYAPKFTSADAQLDWQQPAEQLQRVVRAYNPLPGAWFHCEDERLKCFRACVADTSAATGAPGTVIAAGSDGIDVCCGSGVLRMQQLQRPGRARCSAREVAGQMDWSAAVLT